nr:UbiA prenyltransferase family [uncultured bacterium]
MKRTEKRALVTGKISVTAAITFAVICGVAGSLILLIWVNLITLLIGLWALFFYVVVYGYAKRESSYGTEVGSLPGAASIVAGYTAVTAHIGPAAIILFLTMIFWQMPHFFSIAIFRAKDYAAANIPVLPLKRGVSETKLRILGYTFLFAVTSLSLYFYGYASITYVAVMGIMSLYWLFVGLRGLNTPNPEKWARKMFGVSLLVLLAYSLVLSLDHWLP